MEKESCKDDQHIQQHSEITNVYGTVVHLNVVCDKCGKTLNTVIEV